MRALRLALIAAAVAGLSVATLDTSAFARNGAPGGNGGPGAGAAGGAGSGGSSGGAAGGGGSNFNTASSVQDRRNPPYGLPIPARSYSASCAKREPIYDFNGYLVGYSHGDECRQ
jgi:hypothetical protein